MPIIGLARQQGATIMAGVATVLTLSLAAVFAMSFVAKIFDFRSFHRILQYTLRITPNRGRVLGAGVLAGEGVVAMAGFVRMMSRPVFYADLVLAGVLVVSFTAWASVMLRRRLPVKCPCFGSHAAQVSWLTVLRNLVILVATVLAAVATAVQGQEVVSGNRQAILAAVVLAVACGVAAYRFVRPYLATAKQVRARLVAGGGSFS
jgi:hypothetical protein